MVHAGAITVAAAALLGALPVHAGLYPKSSSVLSIDAKNYDRLIAQSNYTSIVEFYAPWCGHCKNLQPHYAKAAKNLEGLAKVAAVDCDDENNKAFCSGFGVKGFPTLKIVRPGGQPGRPVVEDYQGERTAKAIVNAVIDKIPNLVKRVDDKTLEAWLAEANDTAKAILFSDKGKTSALWKAIAIEFKGSISVAQIRNTDKEKAALELFGITKFPTLLLLPGGKEAQGIVYDGEIKKDAMVKFLSQAAAPNPDPAPPKTKIQKAKDSKKAKAAKESKEKEAFESASKSQAKEEGSSTAAEASESPKPEGEHEKPVAHTEPTPPIGIFYSEQELRLKCLSEKTGTCILAMLPAKPNDLAKLAVAALSEIEWRHHLHGRTRFPFFAVPPNNPGWAKVQEALGLTDGTELIAVNARRGWWRKLPLAGDKIDDKDVTEEALENWIDSIRLDEGKSSKMKLPEGLVPEEPVVEEAAEEPVEEPASEDAAQKPLAEESKAEEAAAETKDEKTKEKPHDEL